MADTIYYQGKIKRGKKPLEVFEKIKKAIKKKGPTEGWLCTIDEEKEQLCIAFPDGSENFILEFNEKGEFNSFCKVYFLDKDSEEGKGEFQALLDVIYQAKSMFSTIEIHDDYGLAESYWDSKRFKIQLRELTQEEKDRAMRLYLAGYTGHEKLLLAVMAEDMEMSVGELLDYINIDICCFSDHFPQIFHILESYLYETAEFQKEGRLCELPDWQYYDLGKVSFSVYAFLEGLAWVFLDGTGYGTILNPEKKRAFSQKDAQVGLLFREKFAPQFLKLEDSLERCLLVYRYFVSVYDFLGFRYAGRAQNIKTVMDDIIEEYGEEKGEIFLTGFCTSERYIFSNHMEEKKNQYGSRLVKNLKERYGESMPEEYLEFEQKYRQNIKFRHETKYMAQSKKKYIDDSLVL